MKTLIVVLAMAMAMAMAFAMAQVAAASDGESLAWAMVLKPQCDKHVPGFAAKAREPFEKLRRRNAEFAAAFDAHSAADAAARDAPKQGSDLEQMKSQCEAMLIWVREDGLPPDPRLATPEKTWNHFLGAMRSGDKELLADCLSGSARETILPMLMQMGAPDLAKLADSFKSFDLTKVSTGEYQEALVERTDGMSGLMLFVKTPRGWRISQL